jgi:unsaturated chondroitin disaccharide hydrolase
MRYNFRPDGTSYHVAVFDAETGAYRYSCTHQGYADDSMWARGQAWGIYGYTMVYRFTREPRFLEFAQKIADVYLARLPEDKVPYWDFCDPEIPNASKDASAAAVVASALLELSTYTDGKYRADAEAMLRSLYENYRAPEGCDSFLLHSTGHHPAGKEIDYSIVYADYYFIEALLRLKNL